MSKMTQTDAVLALLRTRGELGLTAIEAMEMVGTMRLAARIADARARLGPDEWIETITVTTYGGAHVARYVLRRSSLWEPRA